MKKLSTQTLDESDNTPHPKENINHKEYPKMKVTFLDIRSNKKDFGLKTKLSVRSLKSTNTKLKKNPSRVNFVNNVNKEPKRKYNKLTNLNLNYNDIPLAKSSLNINKNLLDNKTIISKGRLAKTKSQYDSNNNRGHHKANNLEQTKNNFLKLITRKNEGNYIKDYNASKFGHLNSNNINFLEGDDLTIVEKTLQNKIIEMEKEFEYMEFDLGNLDKSANKYNSRKKRKKITTKKTKDFDNKKFEKNKKFITTTINKKKMLSQISSSNSNKASSENILSRNNQFLDDSRMNLSEKKNMGSNMFSSKLKFSSSHNKKSKYRSERGSNRMTSNFANNSNNNKNSNKTSNHSNKRSKVYEALTAIFKSNQNKYDFHEKETIINKSKTFSTDSKLGQTLVTNTESYDKIGSLTSEKEMVIDKEKFRVLIHKKLVYDSLDDEELMEDAVIENFYFAPNSIVVIIIDAMVLILTFWSMVYKPLNLVLNNCDVQNTITTFSFDNISNLFIDILFICDLIINFFKAYYNFDEQLITNSYKIFLHYFKNFFIVDLISAIPFYTITKFIALKRYTKYGTIVECSELYNHQINDGFQILEVLKLIKMLKCMSRTNIVTNYILNESINFTFFENWSYMIFTLILFILLMHLTACIHIFVSCMTFPNWITLNNLHYSSLPTIYLSSIYFLITTVTSVGYGDIIGKSFIEHCFQIFLLLVGIIAYSWLISSVSNYVKEKNKQNEIFEKKISMLNEIKLEHPNMSKELYDKIYLHLEYINLQQKKDKSSLIDSLPHTVTKTLLYEMYKPIIENFNFFKNFKNSEFINRVISKLKPIIAVKNDLLFDQGEIIEESFFVKQGRLSLEVKIDPIHPEKSVEKLLDEEYFFGVENNELYQKNAFALIKMTSIKPSVLNSSINQKNLYNLYSKKDSFDMNNINKKDMKSILTNNQGKGKVIKHLNDNSNCIYLRILDIRKNEHFGALLMFLNKRSPLSLRVKTKKAELYFLKKIDAIEISSSYPNIWKRVNRASFHNLKQIKKIMHKIIKHFCETYGINFMKKICEENSIKDADELKKIYTIQNTFSKENYNNDFTIINKSNNNLMSQKLTAMITKPQFNMLKEFLNNNNNFSNNEQMVEQPYEENVIEKQVIKDLDITNQTNKEKNQASSGDFDSPLNCTLNIVKNKNNKDNSKSGKSFDKLDNSKQSKKTKVHKDIFDDMNSNESKYSKETKTRDGIINKPNTKYGKEATKILFKNYGTPFYPEDVNDEIYSLEKKSNNSNNNSINNNNTQIEELEYIPDNYLLSSQDSIKNNYLQTIKELNIKKINGISDKANNVTINNNFITNNVINNIQTMKIKNELCISQFGFDYKRQNKEVKKYNLKIYKNSFELLSFKSNVKIEFGLKNNIKSKKSEENIINLKENKNKSLKKTINSKFNKNHTDYPRNNSFSSESSNGSFSSNKDKDNKKEKIKSFTDNIPIKKPIKSYSSFSSSSSSSRRHKGCIISKNERLHYNSEYFNFNQLSNGKFSKNKSLQTYIKNIILNRIARTHSRIELPRIAPVLKASNSNKALSPEIKKRATKKFTFFVQNNKLHKTKFKNSLRNSIAKNQRSNIMYASELNDKGKGSPTKKKYKKSSNNAMILNYINRNIRDDSTALKNPGKFYNGLFNDMMKNYTKANIKPSKK